MIRHNGYILNDIGVVSAANYVDAADAAKAANEDTAFIHHMGMPESLRDAWGTILAYEGAAKVIGGDGVILLALVETGMWPRWVPLDRNTLKEDV